MASNEITGRGWGVALGLQLIFFAEIFLSFLKSMIVLTVYP